MHKLVNVLPSKGARQDKLLYCYYEYVMRQFVNAE